MNDTLLRLASLRNRYLLMIDASIMMLTPFIALWVRGESFSAIPPLAGPLAVFAVLMVLGKCAVLYSAGVYKQYWSYAGEDELFVLLKAVSLAIAAELGVFFCLLAPLSLVPAGFPRSLPVIDGLLTILLICSLRIGTRLLFVFVGRQSGSQTPRPVLIAGAGMAGLMVAKELQEDNSSGLVPIGFVDDDPLKQGKILHGLPVVGTISELRTILGSREIHQVIIAIPSASGAVVRRVVMACKDCGVESKTVPGLMEILRGSARVEQFRNIQVEDLLRRGTVRGDARSVGALLRRSRVMITGAGGSIGSEICRQVRDFDPSEIILVGHGENSVFAIAQELRERLRWNQTLSVVVADIRDRGRMEEVLRKHRPQIVFHAAAHKHVGLMQNNVPDAVTNNVLGTRNLVELCVKYEVDRFVMISSDKAVNPTSVMGATKRAAELLVQDAAARSGRRFTTVRFGNVLGSRGSVVPIFQKQIEEGGPVTVTDPEVKRYFMTIPESVQLVLQAATMGVGGEVFVLDMGDQIRVADLARDMIRLHGLKEGEDIEITYTGLLPGEKMSEELFFEGDEVEKTAHPKVMVCRNTGRYSPGNEPMWGVTLRMLAAAAEQGNETELISLLKTIVPQFSLALRPGPAPSVLGMLKVINRPAEAPEKEDVPRVIPAGPAQTPRRAGLREAGQQVSVQTIK